jgi:hypothetical protein
MNIDRQELARQVAKAQSRGWAPIIRQAEEKHGLPAGLLLAIASRETNVEDIVGDAGHGRGLFQIDDRAHGDWLAQHGAAGAGVTPPLAEAADYAATIVAQNLAFARKKGVAQRDELRFAVSAYNAGCGGALAGHQSGDCDKRTTGRDYGNDVLQRLAAIQGQPAAAGDATAPAAASLLKKGASGPAVTQLKHDLQTWFDQHAPGQWATFGVAPTAAFGPGLERCVRAFQERSGLDVDGVVGPKTMAALRAGVPAPA